MNGRDEETLITENDVRSSSIKRRTFLGRFGLAAGLIGVAGMAQACGSGAASDSDGAASDSDQMEASDSDQMESSDSDSQQEETEESSDSDSGSDSAH